MGGDGGWEQKLKGGMRIKEDGSWGWKWEKEKVTLKMRIDEGKGNKNWEEGWDENKNR